MNNNSILTRMFSQNTIKSIINNKDDVKIINSVVTRYNISHDQHTNNEEIISQIYNVLGKEYRNEYYYKNTLLNKLIINVHRINTTTALTEVPISKSKADFIMINGKAVVYEIKTELDTFERLESQINDYYKAFDHVCVVTSESQAKSLEKRLQSSPVGIYVLTKQGTIKRLKEPIEYTESLDYETIFKVLNKPEYEAIVKQVYKSLPDVTQVKYYKECEKLLSNIELDEFYKLVIKQLKKRNNIEIIDFKTIPYSLRFLVYFSKLKKSDIYSLQTYLKETYEKETE